MTSADSASMALRTSRDRTGRDGDDRDLETLRVSYLGWEFDRLGDMIVCRSGGYRVLAADRDEARRGIIARLRELSGVPTVMA